jgi:hypothetical protein
LVIQDDNANPGATTVTTPAYGSLVGSTPPLPAAIAGCAVPGPLMAAGSCSAGSNVHTITENEIAAVAAEAVARLGLVSRNVTFSASVLPTGQLAEATARGILVSPTAAGFGWYVDLTPGDDAEFVDVVNPRTGDHELRARPGGPADGRMDLLTTLMHELEHTLGRGDLYSLAAQHDLMAASLPAGVRRLPRAVRDTLGGSHE